MFPQDAPPSIFGPTVDLLCSWGQHEHLLGAVVDSLKKESSMPGAEETESGPTADGSGVEPANEGAAPHACVWKNKNKKKVKEYVN